MPGRNDSDAKYLNLPFTQRHTGDAAFPTVPLGAVTVVLTGDFVLFPAGVGLGLGAGLGVGVACGVTGCAGVAPGVGVGVALGCCCAIESASNVSNSSVCAFACDVKTTALRMVKETASHIFFIALPYISFRVRNSPRAMGLPAAGKRHDRCHLRQKRSCRQLA